MWQLRHNYPKRRARSLAKKYWPGRGPCEIPGEEKLRAARSTRHLITLKSFVVHVRDRARAVDTEVRRGRRPRDDGPERRGPAVGTLDAARGDL